MKPVPTGIHGIDHVTGGGLPAERVTLVMGSAGSGKTVLALQTLAHGAAELGEPGLFVAFEEASKDILEHAAGFDWPLGAQVEAGHIAMVDAQLDPDVVQAGQFDLAGLLAMLKARADQIGAQRIVLDGVDVLLDLLGDPALIRREVFRLRSWLLQSGLTGIVTAKTNADGWLRADYDFLQFLSDCVISMQHRVTHRTAARSLRVWKYRGADHSANEHPFTIGRSGIDVSTGGATDLASPISSERVSAGFGDLDNVVGGGYYRGSAVLITGAPGTAKTTLCGAFAAAACERGEPTLYVTLDEPPPQIERNLRSVGLQLQPHIDSGMLRIVGLRSRAAEPELQSSRIRALIHEHGARNLVVDPISAIMHGGEAIDAEAAALELVSEAKARTITVVGSSLFSGTAEDAQNRAVGLSTVADTWIHLSYKLQGGERNRALSVIKSRGTAHSNQMRELILGDQGIRLANVYTAGGEVLMGTLRWEKERQNQERRKTEEQRAEQRRRELQSSLAEMDARIEALRRQHENVESQLETLSSERSRAREARAHDERKLQLLRGSSDAPQREEGEE